MKLVLLQAADPLEVIVQSNSIFEGVTLYVVAAVIFFTIIVIVAKLSPGRTK